MKNPWLKQRIEVDTPWNCFQLDCVDKAWRLMVPPKEILGFWGHEQHFIDWLDNTPHCHQIVDIVDEKWGYIYDIQTTDITLRLYKGKAILDKCHASVKISSVSKGHSRSFTRHPDSTREATIMCDDPATLPDWVRFWNNLGRYGFKRT